MPVRIVNAVTYDVRFPTSRSGAGSDAMNPDPDYSAAYVALETDDPSGLAGHGVTMLVNAGPPEDLAPLNNHVQSVLGDRAIFERTDDERIEVHLARLGL